MSHQVGFIDKILDYINLKKKKKRLRVLDIFILYFQHKTYPLVENIIN